MPIKEHFSHVPECSWARIKSRQWESEKFVNLSTSINGPHSELSINARTDTFVNWPHKKKRGWNATAASMANAGFYYTPDNPTDDTASCAFCDVTLDGWEPEDSPFDEHNRRNPDCIYFTVPKSKERQESLDPFQKATSPSLSQTKKRSSAAVKEKTKKATNDSKRVRLSNLSDEGLFEPLDKSPIRVSLVSPIKKERVSDVAQDLPEVPQEVEQDVPQEVEQEVPQEDPRESDEDSSQDEGEFQTPAPEPMRPEPASEEHEQEPEDNEDKDTYQDDQESEEEPDPEDNEHSAKAIESKEELPENDPEHQSEVEHEPMSGEHEHEESDVAEDTEPGDESVDVNETESVGDPVEPEPEHETEHEQDQELEQEHEHEQEQDQEHVEDQQLDLEHEHESEHEHEHEPEVKQLQEPEELNVPEEHDPEEVNVPEEHASEPEHEELEPEHDPEPVHESEPEHEEPAQHTPGVKTKTFVLEDSDASDPKTPEKPQEEPWDGIDPDVVFPYLDDLENLDFDNSRVPSMTPKEWLSFVADRCEQYTYTKCEALVAELQRQKALAVERIQQM